MTTVQERFEVERSIGVVYEALCQPYDLLRSLPGISNVTPISDDVYRIAVGQGGDTREVDLMIAGKIPAQHVEWRLANDTWTAAFDLSSTGPARTAVAVRCEGVPTIEGEAPPEEAIQQGFDAFKTALRAPHVRVHTRPIGAEGQYAGSPRRFASDWRSGRAEGSMFARPIDYPFKLMQGLSKQMDRLWDQMWRATPVGRLPQMMPNFSHMPGIPGVSWSPSVEVCEKDDQVRICMDVPGVDESNLQVQIDEGALTIRGERQDERPDEAGHRRSELHYGAFTRRIPLPDGVDPDGAQAVLRKGVLEIRIPLHKRQPRRVPVQHVPS